MSIFNPASQSANFVRLMPYFFYFSKYIFHLNWQGNPYKYRENSLILF